MKDFNIHESGNNVLTESVLNGIDVNNILFSNHTSGYDTNYTAIQDCYVFVYAVDSVYIDNISFLTDNCLFLLKNGQTFKSHNKSNGRIDIYGIKR